MRINKTKKNRVAIASLASATVASAGGLCTYKKQNGAIKKNINLIPKNKVLSIVMVQK